MPRPGKCRACNCVEERACANGCAWANASRTLCTACVCGNCGAKFVTYRDYVYNEAGDRVCRGRAKCAARQVKNELAQMKLDDTELARVARSSKREVYA